MQNNKLTALAAMTASMLPPSQGERMVKEAEKIKEMSKQLSQVYMNKYGKKKK